tara:strand:+ start:745 stop:1410 length:666 start_codon:yes stop_codon:yes gene_type:complete
MAIDKITTPAVTDDSVTLAKMAPGTDGNIISYDASGNPVAVATGSAGQVLTSAGAGAPPTFAAAAGITMADQWRQSASSSISGQDKTYITSNWERTDSDSYGTIGSAMSESSGVFTFPATGIYYLQFFFQGKNTSGSVSRYTDGFIDVTTNNSSYNLAASGFASSAGNLRDFNCTATFILDVTNTSNVKIKTAFQVEHTCSMYGSTDSTSTNLTVIRLGDT